MTRPGSTNLPSAPCWAANQAAALCSTWASMLMKGRACRKHLSTKAVSLQRWNSLYQCFLEAETCSWCFSAHILKQMYERFYNTPGASRRVLVSECTEGAVCSLIGELSLITWGQQRCYSVPVISWVHVCVLVVSLNMDLCEEVTDLSWVPVLFYLSLFSPCLQIHSIFCDSVLCPTHTHTHTKLLL